MKKNSLFVANEREIVSSHLYPCTKNFASSCLAKERLLFSLKMPMMLKTSIQHVCTDFSSLKPQSYG